MISSNVGCGMTLVVVADRCNESTVWFLIWCPLKQKIEGISTTYKTRFRWLSSIRYDNRVSLIRCMFMPLMWAASLQFNEMKNNCVHSSHPRRMQRASVWPFTTLFPLNPVLERLSNEKLQKFRELFYLKLLRHHIEVCLSKIPIHVW